MERRDCKDCQYREIDEIEPSNDYPYRCIKYKKPLRVNNKQFTRYHDKDGNAVLCEFKQKEGNETQAENNTNIL